MWSTFKNANVATKTVCLSAVPRESGARRMCAWFCNRQNGKCHAILRLPGVRTLAPVLLGACLLVSCSSTDPDVIRGKQLFTAYNCTTCHSMTSDLAVTGPTLKGLYGSQVPLDDGTVAVADEAYLRESIVRPNAKIRVGWFSDQMLTISGQYQQDLEKPENLSALVAYIKGAK